LPNLDMEFTISSHGRPSSPGVPRQEKHTSPSILPNPSMISEFLWMSRRAARSLSVRRNFVSIKKDLLAWKHFWQSYHRYRDMAQDAGKPTIKDLFPCLGDDLSTTPIEPIYFYQDAWAFERIIRRRADHHVDIGSHYKFVSLLSKAVPTTMVDIRPLSLPLDSIRFLHGSILELPFEDNTVDSLSSLCVIEHIGLGRYGDPLDPLGSEKAIKEICRVLSPRGHAYLSFPVGRKNMVQFNAHRIFSLDYIHEITQPLSIIDQGFIIGSSFHDTYSPEEPAFSVGLFELKETR
jgi:SAM-dependent methyltransferase